MKLIRVCAGLVGAMLVTGSALAGPDLVVSRLRIDPEAPHSHAVVAVAALIENVGTGASEAPFDVRFRDNAREISKSVVESGFGAGEAREIFAAWVAEPGDHVLSVAVDEPSNDVREVDEGNNGASLAVTVGAGTNPDEAPRVAVLEFDDQSRARLDNLGVGVADKLAARLSESGVRIVGRGEMDARMQEQRLDPTSADGLSFAARELGVDYVVTGVVENVIIAEQTLGDLLGLVHLSSSQARVDLTARWIGAANGASADARASGNGEGATSLSLDLGSLFSSSPLRDVCSGGLQSERAAYAEGGLVSLGVRNASASGWLGLEVTASDGSFLRWLGWRYVGRDECTTWIWNQRDALGSPVGPGIYTARLRDGEALTDAATFQIRPGLNFTLPSLDRVTVGTSAFDSDAVGMAIDDAVNELAASLLALLADSVQSAAPFAARAYAAAGAPLLGQVAASLLDGRVTVSIGSSSGVAVGDRFEVIAVEHLTYDPNTMSIVSYDVVASRGVIEIIEVRERASTGICVGSCAPSVGDLVRRVP